MLSPKNYFLLLWVNKDIFILLDGEIEKLHWHCFGTYNAGIKKKKTQKTHNKTNTRISSPLWSLKD